jgi:hypothetical protein
MLTIKQMELAETIEEQLTGESKETAEKLFLACSLFLSVENLTRRISLAASVLVVFTLIGKELNFFLSVTIAFLCFLTVHIFTREYLIRRNKEDIQLASDFMHYIMSQSGSHSIAKWLESKDRDVGRVIRQVVSY